MCYNSLYLRVMEPLRITSYHPVPKFNGHYFGMPPSTIHTMTGLGGTFVWTSMYSHKSHSCPLTVLDENRPKTFGRNGLCTNSFRVTPTIHHETLASRCVSPCPKSVVVQCRQQHGTRTWLPYTIPQVTSLLQFFSGLFAINHMWQPHFFSSFFFFFNIRGVCITEAMSFLSEDWL